jgi:hypothetical protein
MRDSLFQSAERRSSIKAVVWKPVHTENFIRKNQAHTQTRPLLNDADEYGGECADVPDRERASGLHRSEAGSPARRRQFHRDPGL